MEVELVLIRRQRVTVRATPTKLLGTTDSGHGKGDWPAWNSLTVRL